MATLALSKVFIQDTYTVGGPMEYAGPIGHRLDQHYLDLYAEQRTFEQAERQMVKDAISGVLSKTHLSEQSIDIAFGGDLLNQITSSGYVMREFRIPFIGVYGACSTSMLSVALASSFIEGGLAENALAFTSSHNATAERQFRYPLEYGIQKKETLTYTATGAVAMVLGTKRSKVRVTHVTFGRIIDMQSKDPADMGTAMAPAAFDTLKQHLEDTKRSPEDYDLILTGDLSLVGKSILLELAAQENINLKPFYEDCGLILFDREKQQVFAGGSGCACCGITSYGHVYRRLINKEIKRVFIMATGALHSPTVVQQKETIPSVAHGVVWEGVEE